MTIAYAAGIAPRSTVYMRAHWGHAKGLLDDAGLAKARHEEAQRWLAAQRAAGLDAVSPSYVETEDILRPLSAVAGAEAGSLTRTFETNTFHRRPRFDTAISATALRAWVDSVRVPGAWILTLPSPYDVVVRSDVADQVVEDSIAACLCDAAGHALANGALRVRFQEPSATYRGHVVDTGRLGRVLRIATQGIEEKCVVHFTQGDVLARPDILEAVPTRGIGIDVHETAAHPGHAPGGNATLTAAAGHGWLTGKQLHVGIVRGESSLLEPSGLGRAAIQLAKVYGAQLWAVTNGWDLEHVPFDVAVGKLAVLAAARRVEVVA